MFKKCFWVCGSGGVFESCTFYLHDGRPGDVLKPQASTLLMLSFGYSYITEKFSSHGSPDRGREVLLPRAVAAYCC